MVKRIILFALVISLLGCSELTLDYFPLTIPKSGKYTINVEGKNASGELKILKVDHEMVNQASDLDSKNNLSPYLRNPL